MKNVRKNTLKTLVLIALMCPAAFADGDMGGGGLGMDTGPVKVQKEIRSTEDDGDMGGGGRPGSYIDWVLDSIDDYLGSII